MADPNIDRRAAVQDWNTYWQGSQQGTAFANEGVSHPTIAEFWKQYFEVLKPDAAKSRLIDVACGKGAVLEIARSAFSGNNIEYTCLDSSEQAVATVTSRFPDVQGHVVDARSMNLRPRTFDIVVSQFGIEYAGLAAVRKIAELVAPGGHLALVLHQDSSSIYEECASDLAATEELQASRYIQLAIAMFRTGFEALRGEGSSQAYRASTEAVIPGMREVEAIMNRHGDQVAGGTILKLYHDVANIQGKIQKYDENEIRDWLVTMNTELQAYAGRMASMCQAALSKDDFDDIQSVFSGKDFTISTATSLPETGQSLGWVLVASRNN